VPASYAIRRHTEGSGRKERQARSLAAGVPSPHRILVHAVHQLGLRGDGYSLIGVGRINRSASHGYQQESAADAHDGTEEVAQTVIADT
jgi:hypothetical protein